VAAPRPALFDSSSVKAGSGAVRVELGVLAVLCSVLERVDCVDAGVLVVFWAPVEASLAGGGPPADTVLVDDPHAASASIGASGAIAARIRPAGLTAAMLFGRVVRSVGPPPRSVGRVLRSG